MQERLGEALLALDEENYPAALLDFFYCLNLGHEPQVSRYGILWCYAGLGQFEQARGWSSQFHPERAEAALGLLDILEGSVARGLPRLLGLFNDFGELPLPPPRELCFALLAELRPGHAFRAGGKASVWTTRALVLRWLDRHPEAFACLAEALKGSEDFLPATAQMRDHWISQRPSLPAPGQTYQERVELPQGVPEPGPARPSWYDDHLEGGNTESLYRRAEAEAREEKWYEALEWLRRLSLADPFHLSGTLLRFEVLLAVGERQQAFQEGCAAMDMLENSDQLERARALGRRLAVEFPDRARAFLKNVLLGHRSGDYRAVSEWGQQLMAHYRQNSREHDALATLMWLARLPLETQDRVEVELQLAQTMVESGRAEEAQRRLQVYLTQWHLESLVSQKNYHSHHGRFEELLKGAESLLSKETIAELRQKAAQLKGP